MAESLQKQVARLRKNWPTISAQRLKERLETNEAFCVVDVREGEEFRNGHIPSTVHLPRGFLEMQVEKVLPLCSAALIIYCSKGIRSLFAAETLTKMGYQNLTILEQGFDNWVQLGLPVEKPATLSEAGRLRYARHLTLPEIGEAGQIKLAKSKVLIVGIGGLGCSAAYYLAAAGVGTLGIVDFDVVDESNLQRQILHTPDRLGIPKVESARTTLKEFNPDIKLLTFKERLSSSNVERIFNDFDVIVDGSDNLSTRYLINDSCFLLKKPWVHGSVYRFRGHTTVLAPNLGGPCYRCLFPTPPPPEEVPSCAEAGVLGVLPGIIGLMEANEVIKLVLNIGKPLIGRLVTYDGLAATVKEFKIQRNPGCEVCSETGKSVGITGFDDLHANLPSLF